MKNDQYNAGGLAYTLLHSSDLWSLVFTTVINFLKSTLSLFFSQLFLQLSCYSSYLPSFHLSTLSLLAALSVSSIMMLIKWAEWIIQIPMAFPLLRLPLPFCLQKGIIHLALSLCTHAIWVHTHTGRANTETD